MVAQAKLTKRVGAAVAGAAKRATRAKAAAAAGTSFRTCAAASALELRSTPVQLYLRTVPTPLGPFSLYVDADGAVRCCHWQRSAPGDEAALHAEALEMCKTMQSRWYKDAAVTLGGVWAEGVLTDKTASTVPGATAAALLTQYFNPPTAAAGRPAELERLLLQVPIVYPSTTPFVAQTWTTLRHTVPSGETISYKGLGVRVNKALKLPATAASAPRAVGAAMGANPIPIIVPCHRVLSTTHSLRGYGLGLRFKVWLLRHEQASVAADRLRVGEGVDAVSTAASLR